MAAITISEYISGRVAFEITEAALASIFFDRGINAWADASVVSEEKRQLCYADALMWGATLPSNGKRVEDADADWKHAETGVRTTEAERTLWRKMANDIYTKYGESTKSFGFSIKTF